MGVFNDLPPSFTIMPETTWRWGNAISTLLVPQRGFLLGLPLAVIVFTQWWLAAEGGGEKEAETKREKGRRGAVAKKNKKTVVWSIDQGLLFSLSDRRLIVSR